MPWKYCDECKEEIDRPELSDFKHGQWPLCPQCETRIDCDREELIIEEIIALQEQMENKE